LVKLIQTYVNKTNKKPSPGGISSEAVKKATGKSWEEWFKILDMIDAAKMTHKEIASWIYGKKLTNGWWAQMVTVGYEQARGMRETHQVTGGYKFSVSITVNTPIDKLYKSVADEKFRRKWLKDKIEISSQTKNKYLRAGWSDGKTRIAVNFYPKGKDKSQVVVEHQKLENSKQVKEKKSFWKNKIAGLKKILEK